MNELDDGTLASRIMKFQALIFEVYLLNTLTLPMISKIL